MLLWVTLIICMTFHIIYNVYYTSQKRERKELVCSTRRKTEKERRKPRCFVVLVVLIFTKLLLSVIVMWQWTKTDDSHVKYYEKGKRFVLFFDLADKFSQ